MIRYAVPALLLVALACGVWLLPETASTGVGAEKTRILAGVPTTPVLIASPSPTVHDAPQPMPSVDGSTHAEVGGRSTLRGRPRSPLSTHVVGQALKRHVDVVLLGDATTIRDSQRALRTQLSELAPSQVVSLLRKDQPPAALDELLRWIDRQLDIDRPKWERALFLGMESADTDFAALVRVTEVAEPRIHKAVVRSRAAQFLAKRETREEVTRLLAKFRAPSD